MDKKDILLELFKYYGTIAAEKDLKFGKIQKYSNAWYYFNNDKPCFNNVTKHFLHNEKLKRKEVSQESLNRFKAELKGSLNDSQIVALATSLENDVTIIQGPPGTGKTRVIYQIIRHLYNRRQTVAAVSSNKIAINEINKLLSDDSELKDKSAFLGNIEIRKLFNKTHNETEYKFENKPSKKINYEYTGINGNNYDNSRNVEGKMEMEYFLRKYPIITSTIHSLPVLFKDAYTQETTYDYVIIDEASLITFDLGIIAMNSGKRLIIVGDDNQLPPIIDNEKINKVNDVFPDIDFIHRQKILDSSDPHNNFKSFMETCLDIFGVEKLFLNEHYRCHPAIIGFCNETIYDGKIKIRTKNDKKVPIRVRWFDGNHCEKYLFDKEKDKRITKVNYKQIRILIEEEFDSIIKDIKKNKSVCLMTPFVGQLAEIEKQLSRRLKEELNNQEIIDIIESKEFIGHTFYGYDEKKHVYLLTKTIKYKIDKILLDPNWYSLGNIWSDDDKIIIKSLKMAVLMNFSKIEDNPSFFFETKNENVLIESFIKSFAANYFILKIQKEEGTEEEYNNFSLGIDCLTIHKSQGSEYDVVYLLPVEDNKWDKPWSQGKQLINVAVSRAKEKLVVITSSNLMDTHVQAKLNVEEYDSLQEEGHSYIKKLISYVFNKFKQKPNYQDGAYGFHKSKIVSVFDHPVKRGQKTESESDAEETILKLLKKLKLHYKQQVELRFMIRDEVRNNLDPNDFDYIDYCPTFNLNSNIENNNQHNKSAAYDFVVYSDKGKKTPIFAIEVDGEQHRSGYNMAKEKWEYFDDISKYYSYLKESKDENEKNEERKNKISKLINLKLLRLSTSGQRHTLDGEDYDVDVKDMDGKTSIEEMIIRRLVGDLTCSATFTKNSIVKVGNTTKRGMMNI